MWSAGAVLRGGNWNNDTNAGVFNVNLNNDPTISNNNLGFRCALAPLACLDLKVNVIKK